MQASRVFLSHSSHDKEFAGLVAAALRSPDMAPWIDSEQIVTGDDIFDQLGHGLQVMDVFVFLVSEPSLASEWVSLEVKFAAKREVAEKRVLVLPFIIDKTPTDALPWFLSHRNASRVTADANGAASIAATVRQVIQGRLIATAHDEPKQAKNKGDPSVGSPIKNVKLGDWSAADSAALQILEATDEGGRNETFEALLQYLDHPIDDDTLWGALMTIESCAQLAPQWIDHRLLTRMANHTSFPVRASAASICMDWAQFAPDRVPVNLLLKLAVHNEDWYVQAPATAALQAMARSQPAILRLFYSRLRSPDPDARAHAAAALADIADKEPEILESGTLQRELSRLEQIGDREAGYHLAKALPKIIQAKETIRFKYGI